MNEICFKVVLSSEVSDWSSILCAREDGRFGFFTLSFSGTTNSWLPLALSLWGELSKDSKKELTSLFCITTSPLSSFLGDKSTLYLCLKDDPLLCCYSSSRILSPLSLLESLLKSGETSLPLKLVGVRVTVSLIIRLSLWLVLFRKPPSSLPSVNVIINGSLSLSSATLELFSIAADVCYPISLFFAPLSADVTLINVLPPFNMRLLWKSFPNLIVWATFLVGFADLCFLLRTLKGIYYPLISGGACPFTDEVQVERETAPDELKKACGVSRW